MQLPVFGMTCERCEAKVELALAAVAGVSAVKADRHANNVTFVMNEPQSALLAEAIVNAGYSLVPAQTEISNTEQVTTAEQEGAAVRLDILGMSCASCVRSVEQALLSVPGVSSVSVNYANSSAQVMTSTSVGDLIRAVKHSGYEARTSLAATEGVKLQVLTAGLVRNILKSVIALSLGAALMLNHRMNLVAVSPTEWIVVGALVLAILLVTGGRYYLAAFAALRQRRATMDSLISLGTGTAWCYSMLVLLLPDLISVDSRHLFFEAALFVMGFVHLGKSLEEYARGKTSLALGKLLTLQAKFAVRKTAQGDESVPVEDINVDDLIMVRAGETVPLDGVVVEGRASVDEQMISGESLPVMKSIHDKIVGGTINLDGALLVRVTNIGANTFLARMINAVQIAQNSKPPIAQLVDQIAAVFVPAVLVVAFFAASIWWWLSPEFSAGLSIFMTVLVVACPCAMGLAIPMSIMVGIGRGARLGFLVRNSESLQRASKVNTLVLDKTGTLTEGKPQVSAVALAPGTNADDLANIALSLQLTSLHPLAGAVVRYFDTAERLDLDNVEAKPGAGVSATWQGKSCMIGNAQFLSTAGYSDFEGSLPNDWSDDLPNQSSLIYVGLEGKILGVVAAVDQLRDGAQEVINDLKAMEIEVLLLSGDRASVVASVADQLGIAFQGELSPEGKQKIIAAKQAQGAVVAMVGDGINDALALSQADVGFAMGAGSDIAIETADITLIQDNLDALSGAIQLARATMNNIKQNLVAAFAYNVALLPIAAGILFPFWGILLEPGLAGLAMALSSISVVANALRLNLVA